MVCAASDCVLTLIGFVWFSVWFCLALCPADLRSSRLAVNLLGTETPHLSRLTVNLLEVETSGYPHSSRLTVNLLGVETSGYPQSSTNQSPLTRDTIFFIVEIRVTRSKCKLPLLPLSFSPKGVAWSRLSLSSILLKGVSTSNLATIASIILPSGSLQSIAGKS